MRNGDATPQIKYRKDYQPFPFRVEDLSLNFDIQPGVTVVTATARYERIDPTATRLRLDGEKIELLGILRDGDILTPDLDYQVDATGITILNAGDHFTLTITTRIKPEDNTDLEGLYCSNGIYCTQCEAEGFRKITYFPDRPDILTRYTVQIEADKTAAPVLLSNGNRIGQGDLAEGRHFTVWHDPFPKPCYLFALVAGDLAHIHDTFTTMSGRVVDLYIYTDRGNENRCHHAMVSLKKSMQWDEETYGRAYELDLFNIVAVNDFNAGAMENTSLNIFNSKLVLAGPETATDTDHLLIEAIIAHEYFHNWSGNRVTCRDWFQLSLKEGFTVYRELQFSADMNSAAVKRIEDVELLRNRQFPEDAGPLAHPIRPDSYIEINNFYTPTIYEKGAEVIGMLHSLIGDDAYRAGCDLYFSRHDGEAVTCDDFVACLQENTSVDLTQFKRWYSQAGTPVVSARHHYDATAQTMTITLTQNTPSTPAQPDKMPLHMPIKLGLVSRADGRDVLTPATRLLDFKQTEQIFIIENVTEPAVPSLLRGFSAPVKMMTDLSDDDLFFLLAHDSDGFNRWDAGQTALQRLILGNVASRDYNHLPAVARTAFDRLITADEGDRALLAMALTLPGEIYLAQLMTTVDVAGIHAARSGLIHSLGTIFKDKWLKLYHALAPLAGTVYLPTPGQVGQRALRHVALRYLQAADPALGVTLAAEQYKTATNMTDRIRALSVLADSATPEAEAALADFYIFAHKDPLLLDKWFSVQANANRPDAAEEVQRLCNHPDFTIRNPNRLRALISAFAVNNPAHFHRADGAGYRLLADTCMAVNKINPQAAARLLTPLGSWRRYDPARQGLMEAELKRILADKDISNDVYEIASKSLG